MWLKKTTRVPQRYVGYVDILYLQKYLPIAKLFNSLSLEQKVYFILSKM